MINYIYLCEGLRLVWGGKRRLWWKEVGGQGTGTRRWPMVPVWQEASSLGSRGRGGVRHRREGESSISI
jgi:hypothetical protein